VPVIGREDARYKNDELNKRVWVLDGWTENEAVTALVSLHNQSPAGAQHAYFLCGGIIRDMLLACTSSFAYVKGQMDELLAHCDREALELVVGGTQARAEDPGNRDRLRTMFGLRSVDAGADAASKKSMAACQVVDSPYLIDKLYGALPPKAWQGPTMISRGGPTSGRPLVPSSSGCSRTRRSLTRYERALDAASYVLKKRTGWEFRQIRRYDESAQDNRAPCLSFKIPIRTSRHDPRGLYCRASWTPPHRLGTSRAVPGRGASPSYECAL
jgi:hypothetical protein